MAGLGVPGNEDLEIKDRLLPFLLRLTLPLLLVLLCPLSLPGKAVRLGSSWLGIGGECIPMELQLLTCHAPCSHA